LSTLAERQLAAWEELAESWHVSECDDDDTGQKVWRCSDCGKGITLSTDRNGVWYRYNHEQWLALKVLHLRNFHPALDPDR